MVRGVPTPVVAPKSARRLERAPGGVGGEAVRRVRAVEAVGEERQVAGPDPGIRGSFLEAEQPNPPEAGLHGMQSTRVKLVPHILRLALPLGLPRQRLLCLSKTKEVRSCDTLSASPSRRLLFFSFSPHPAPSRRRWSSLRRQRSKPQKSRCRLSTSGGEIHTPSQLAVVDPGCGRVGPWIDVGWRAGGAGDRVGEMELIMYGGTTGGT